MPYLPGESDTLGLARRGERTTLRGRGFGRSGLHSCSETAPYVVLTVQSMMISSCGLCLGASFEQLGYTVLPAAELARPLTRDMWQGLAPHEQKQLRYFRPRRVGDVIYNYWD